jgi:steroid 5-alpha reductase family enzyme
LLRESGKKLGDLPERYRKGFLTEGLFRYSRHPNFFCEISIWWVQFLFSASSVGLNYTGLGALLLNLLFLGSTALTEKISSEKYPLYTKYQKTTSKLIPLPSSEPIKTESKKD